MTTTMTAAATWEKHSWLLIHHLVQNGWTLNCYILWPFSGEVMKVSINKQSAQYIYYTSSHKKNCLAISFIVWHCLALSCIIEFCENYESWSTLEKSVKVWEGSSSEIWLICEVGVRNIFYSVSLTKREESTLPSLHLICKIFGFFFLSWNVKMTQKFEVKICQSEKQKLGVNQYIYARMRSGWPS